MTDDIAERARKIGGTAPFHQRYHPTSTSRKNNNAEVVSPKDMLAELCADNQQLTRSLRSTHEVCERHDDVATASLIENLDRRDRAPNMVFVRDNTRSLRDIDEEGGNDYENH